MAISASKLIHGSHHPYLTAPKPISIAHIKLVSEFAVFDRWFASVPSSTQPNRLYVHSATSHGATSNIPSLLVMENRRHRLAAAEAFASSPSSDHHNQQTHEDAPPPRVMGSWASSHGCREKVRARGLVRLCVKKRRRGRTSKVAMNIAHNLVQHDSTKHMEIGHHFIKEKQNIRSSARGNMSKPSEAACSLACFAASSLACFAASCWSFTSFSDMIIASMADD
ncbi:hypothetical protein RJ640_009235 [Escallonia rubra]|uniref:Uncharacterized protein n=1 Tax=Escallonia rubra TaxID=112253 RepID=A0AA88R5M2_9ASTE|nr:hypothetical protein RJ640_009235 [Escallonia rubra]